MENKINNDKILTHECNVLYNLLNPMKHVKSKNSYYSPILQGCMNTCSEKVKIRKFSNILDSGSSSKNVMSKLTKNLNKKYNQKQLRGKPKQES